MFLFSECISSYFTNGNDVALLLRVIWNEAITIFSFLRFAITIQVIGDSPLQFPKCLILATVDRWAQGRRIRPQWQVSDT